MKAPRAPKRPPEPQTLFNIDVTMSLRVNGEELNRICNLTGGRAELTGMIIATTCRAVSKAPKTVEL